MDGFKPFRAADYIESENQTDSIRKYSNNQEAIEAVLNEYPNGKLSYGSIAFGDAGNFFLIEKRVSDAVIDLHLMNKTIRHINSILEPFGLRSQKEAEHYVEPPVKYLIVKLEDA